VLDTDDRSGGKLRHCSMINLPTCQKGILDRIRTDLSPTPYFILPFAVSITSFFMSSINMSMVSFPSCCITIRVGELEGLYISACLMFMRPYSPSLFGYYGRLDWFDFRRFISLYRQQPSIITELTTTNLVNWPLGFLYIFSPRAISPIIPNPISAKQQTIVTKLSQIFFSNRSILLSDLPYFACVAFNDTSFLNYISVSYSLLALQLFEFLILYIQQLFPLFCRAILSFLHQRLSIYSQYPTELQRRDIQYIDQNIGQEKVVSRFQNLLP
jgi:hypothetical protein